MSKRRRYWVRMPRLPHRTKVRLVGTPAPSGGPTRECRGCGKQYSTRCRGCPYCGFLPLKRGRARWMRWVILAAGLAGSLWLARYMYQRYASDPIWHFADWQMFWGTLIFAGIGTVMFANWVGGGGKDVTHYE